jgi:hypothetical protein
MDEGSAFGMEEQLLPREEFEVRVMVLAEHAAAPPDGKLYVNGAGIERVMLPAIPGVLPPLYLAVRVRVPWRLALQALDVKLQILDPDRKPIGPGVLTSRVEVAARPGMRTDDELCFNQVYAFVGWPIAREGMIYYHYAIDDRELATLSLRVARSGPQGPGVPTAQS